MKLFVTGPQRSGTTFVSHALAHDHGLAHIDELDTDVYNYAAFLRAVEGRDNWVSQSPALFYKVRQVVVDVPGVTVVVIRRPVAEICRSLNRIGYDVRHERKKLGLWGDPRPVAEIKYSLWDEWKTDIPNWIELDYHSFRSHPLWVDQRHHFHGKQWRDD